MAWLDIVLERLDRALQMLVFLLENIVAGERHFLTDGRRVVSFDSWGSRSAFGPQLHVVFVLHFDNERLIDQKGVWVSLLQRAMVIIIIYSIYFNEGLIY